MSITVKTDVKVREDNTSDSQADAMCTMILLNDMRRNMAEKREQMLEEGIVQLPVLTPTEGGVSVQTTSTNSVEETDEKEPLDEEELNDIAYAEAMIAAMSAMGKNLSETIDMSSERSVLLKKLSDASVELAQKNLENSIKEIKDMERAERKAKRAERRGMFISRVTNGFMMLGGAIMIGTGLGAGVGAAMIITSAAMLAMDETGTTEDAIAGISKGLEMAGMSEGDAAILASVGYAGATMLVGGGVTAMASKAASFAARGASRAAIGLAKAADAAGEAGAIGSKAIMTGTDLATATRQVANLTVEAAEGATKAAQGARQAAGTARTAADAAIDAASKATSPAQKATLLKVADEATLAANKASGAADVAENVAKTTTQVAKDAIKTAAAYTKGTVSKADMIKCMQGAVKAADDAVVCASGAAKAAEGAEKVSTIAGLAMMSEKGAEAAESLMKTEKGLSPATALDSALQSALSSPVSRGCFTRLSKVAGFENAAKIVQGINSCLKDALYCVTTLTILLTFVEAGFAISAGLHKLEGANIKKESAQTQEDKALIMASSDAIDDQTARESEFLAQMQKAISDAIASLKPQLAKQWRPVTNAIQG